jgi:hypothetical protein
MHFEATQQWEQLKEITLAPPLPNIPKYRNDSIKKSSEPKTKYKNIIIK